MSISPILHASTANTNDTTSQQTSSADQTEDMFMKLLTTELQSQDPTSTMDPTQMVNQITQFNMLSETVKIRELLQQQVSTETSSSAASSAE